jgi:hypothetical protein
MLVFKAKHVISVSRAEAKPYDFKDDEGREVKGTSIKATITALGSDEKVAVITVKGKTIEEVQKKVDALKLTVGQPAEIRIEPSLAGGVAQLRA